MSIRALFATVFSAILIGSARAACSPNFEGVSLLITAGDGNFLQSEGAAPRAPLWLVQQDGKVPAGYNLRNFYDHNSMLTRNTVDNTVAMGLASDSGTDPRQDFRIECDTCIAGGAVAPSGTKLAMGCTMKVSNQLNLCVEIGTGATRNNLKALNCGTNPTREAYSFTKQ